MSNTGIIYGVNGPVIYLKGDSGFKISEMVYVGPEHLVGEIIGLKKGMTTVQVFEETTGLKPGDTVTGTGDAISVLLGPGIIHNIFDGIQRPLEEIAKSSGKYISRGVSVDSLDTSKKWDVHVTVKVGDKSKNITKGDAVLVATGASENMVNFEGWTKPGVIGAGAAQTMMNLHHIKPGNRILMLGSGNVGLVVSYQLMQAGCEVVALADAAPRVGGYGVHAAKVARCGVPFYSFPYDRKSGGR